MANRHFLSIAVLCVTGTFATFNGPALAQTATPATAPVATGLPTTLINYDGANITAEEAFFDIGKQAGIKFVTQPQNLWDSDAMAEPITINLKERPFWSAIRELCRETNLQPSPNYGSDRNDPRRLSLMQTSVMGDRGQARPWSETPIVEVDGFLVQATGFDRQQSIHYQFPKRGQNSCVVPLMVYVDPAVHVVSFNGAARVDEAVDDNGNSLLVDPERARSITYGPNNKWALAYNVLVPLKYPDTNPGKKIAKLRCTLILRGGEKVDTMSVEKPLQAAKSEKAFGDITLTFHSLKKTDATPGQRARYRLTVGVTGDDKRDGDIYNLLQTGQLIDANGVALVSRNGSIRDDMCTLDYSPNDDDGQPAGDPVKWSIELPTATRSMRVPVEFKDLPMP